MSNSKASLRKKLTAWMLLGAFGFSVLLGSQNYSQQVERPTLILTVADGGLGNPPGSGGG